MKSFNKFLGITSLILFVILITSVFVVVSYGLSHPDLFDSFHISWNDDFNFSFSNNRSSEYETILDTDETTITGKIDTIMIDSDMANIIFVEEDRDDILVEHYREKPNTTYYKTSYSTNVSGSTLEIRSDTQIVNIFTDIDYDNYIKITIPYGFILDVYDYHTAINKIDTSNMPPHVNSLYITADIGDIDIHIETEIQFAKLSAYIGSINFTSTESVESCEFESEMGSTTVLIEGSVENLYINSDIGDVNLNINGNLNYGEIETDLSSLYTSFTGSVNELEITSGLGLVELYISEDITVYADAPSITSYVPIMNSDDHVNIKITSDIGSVYIYPISN